MRLTALGNAIFINDMATVIPASMSLVKYDNPVLLSRTTDKKSTRVLCWPLSLTNQARVKSDKLSTSLTQSLHATMSAGGPPIPTPPRTVKLPPMEQKREKELVAVFVCSYEDLRIF